MKNSKKTSVFFLNLCGSIKEPYFIKMIKTVSQINVLNLNILKIDNFLMFITNGLKSLEFVYKKIKNFVVFYHKKIFYTIIFFVLKKAIIYLLVILDLNFFFTQNLLKLKS